MTQLFGNRATFAVDVGPLDSSDLRTVDLWAGGTLLTPVDNMAFVPAFTHLMRSSAARVRQGKVPNRPYPWLSPEENFRRLHADQTEFSERYWFLHWGETVDNVAAYAYLNGDLMIPFTFWRADHPSPQEIGKVFLAQIPPQDLVEILEAAADFLDARTNR
jgi:hypothetical protein